jgi:aspartyl/asparaginyl-tRNA synthetase
MKYYSEKLNRLFDTEQELKEAERQSNLEYWKLELTNAISELAEKNNALEKVIKECSNKIGEEQCDKLLDKIFEERAVVKDEVVKPKAQRISVKYDDEKKFVKDDVSSTTFGELYDGFMELLSKILNEDDE